MPLYHPSCPLYCRFLNWISYPQTDFSNLCFSKAQLPERMEIFIWKSGKIEGQFKQCCLTVLAIAWSCKAWTLHNKSVTLEYSYMRDPWYLTAKNHISSSKAVNPTGSCESSLSFILNMNTLFSEEVGHFLAFWQQKFKPTENILKTLLSSQETQVSWLCNASCMITEGTRRG